MTTQITVRVFAGLCALPSQEERPHQFRIRFEWDSETCQLEDAWLEESPGVWTALGVEQAWVHFGGRPRVDQLRPWARSEVEKLFDQVAEEAIANGEAA